MFGRVRQWVVRHKTLVDAIAITPLLLFSLATVPSYTGRPEQLPALVGVAVTVALLVPLALRRGCPLAVFAFVTVVAFGQWLLGGGMLPADLGVLVGMFTVAAHRRFAWAVAALLTAELGLVLAIVRRWYEMAAASSGQEPRGLLNVLGFYSVVLLALWIGGLYTNMRRSYLAGLEERAQRLERERDAQARVAAAAERERIARELHDVVAHNVSVMVVQADGATYAIDHSPDNARRALETISRTGREALTEMRRLLGVLRGTGGSGSGSEGLGDGTSTRAGLAGLDGHGTEDLSPQPGMNELDELVGQVRAAGLPVDLAVEGESRPLDHGAGLAAYRIVQEALTNALKHAGPVARATVWVHYGDDLLEMRVDDDGRGLSFDGRDGTGHGLIGMRERAAMLGGRLAAGPQPGGGYRVVATLPMGREVE